MHFKCNTFVKKTFSSVINELDVVLSDFILYFVLLHTKAIGTFSSLDIDLDIIIEYLQNLDYIYLLCRFVLHILHIIEIEN